MKNRAFYTRIIFVCCGLFLLGCAQKQEETQQEQAAFVSPSFTDQQELILKKYFTDEQISKMTRFRALYDTATTAASLKQLYREALTINAFFETQTLKVLAPPPNAYQTPILPDTLQARLLFLEKYMPVFSITLVAEGTLLDLSIHYKAFHTKALGTQSPDDEVFFDLIQQVYGDYSGSFPLWFTQTWDYGGGSRLGEGMHLDLFEKINKQVALSQYFKEELSLLKLLLMEDICNEIRYMNSKEKVIKEVNEIIEKIQLTEKEQYAIKKSLKELQASQREQFAIQFDCTNGNCDFGGHHYFFIAYFNRC